MLVVVWVVRERRLRSCWSILICCSSGIEALIPMRAANWVSQLGGGGGSGGVSEDMLEKRAKGEGTEDAYRMITDQ